ncbi:MAG: protein kinase [Gemmatimonadales bacterium]
MTDALTRLTAALADRYRLERELGTGGMATVYLALDLKHQRKVAVKVLRPELAATMGVDRFAREIEVAARLVHPHILGLIDSGESDGFFYYVMPYVEGETLRDRLARSGELPVHEAIRLLGEITDALSVAHKAGVVHRDIKPENILLSGRHAMVMDFGVAKAVTEASGRQQMTTAGIALGTPAYMAPEQASADPQIDGRVDIYALGILAYEMLTGYPPFHGLNPQQTLAAHVTQAPVAVGQRRPGLSPALESVVMRCLEKRAADRFQTADDLVAVLEPLATPSGGMPPTSAMAAATGSAPVTGSARLPNRRARGAVVILTVVLLAGVAWIATHRRNAPPPSDNLRRLVVLPFDNQGDSSREYFANGVTEAITTELTGIGGMSVIPRTTAARYRGTTKSVSEIGQELGVGYVLTGTVQWDLAAGKDPKVRVSPELIRVADTSSVWAHGYEAVLSSVFQVYGEVSTEVAKALQVTLNDPEREALARRPTKNPEAYDLYLRAIDYLNRGLSRENFDAAIPMLERAVKLDPEFALAWGRLSESLGLSHWLYISRKDETLAASEVAAKRALELQPDLPESHRAMGYYRYRKRDYEAALKEFAIVQHSEPNSADLIAAIGYVERRQGRWREAEVHLARVVELDPGSSAAISQLCETYGLLGEYDKAVATCRRGIEVAPDQPDSYFFLGLAQLSQHGDLREVEATYRLALRHMSPERLMVGNARAPAFAIAHDDSLSQAFLETPPSASNRGIADGYILLGDLLRLRGQEAKAAAAYDSARAILTASLRALRDDYGYSHDLGMVYARQGNFDLAIREGRRAVELLPPERDAYFGVENVINLARIYAIAGQAAPAVEQLRRLAGRPSRLTAAMVKIDPDWDRIRSDPGFQHVIAARQR